MSLSNIMRFLKMIIIKIHLVLYIYIFFHTIISHPDSIWLCLH